MELGKGGVDWVRNGGVDWVRIGGNMEKDLGENPRTGDSTLQIEIEKRQVFLEVAGKISLEIGIFLYYIKNKLGANRTFSYCKTSGIAVEESESSQTEMENARDSSSRHRTGTESGRAAKKSRQIGGREGGGKAKIRSV